MTFLSYYLFPLLLPIALYAAWIWYARKRQEKTGGAEPLEPVSVPVFWALVAGFVLLVGSLVWLAFSQGEKPGTGEYRSPSFEGGKIVPAHFE